MKYTLLPPQKTKFAMVMFLQVSVCPPGEGMRGGGGCVAVGVCVAGGMHGGRGHAWQGQCGGRGGVGAGEMATAASSTHPTGMHSCLFMQFVYRSGTVNLNTVNSKFHLI